MKDDKLISNLMLWSGIVLIALPVVGWMLLGVDGLESFAWIGGSALVVIFVGSICVVLGLILVIISVVAKQKSEI